MGWLTTVSGGALRMRGVAAGAHRPLRAAGAASHANCPKERARGVDGAGGFLRAAREPPACWQPAPPASRPIAPVWPRGRPGPRWTPAPAAAAEIFAACPARFNWLCACVLEHRGCRPAPCDSAADVGGRGAVHHCGACSQSSALEAVLGGGSGSALRAELLGVEPALHTWDRGGAETGACVVGIGDCLA